LKNKDVPSERELAIMALVAVIEDKAYSNIALNNILTMHKLNSQQKSFITQLVKGTIRNLIYIDYILSSFSKAALNKIEPLILANLRISIYQLKYMDKVPVYAICNEAVRLSKIQTKKPLAGFVNGILRAVARNIDNIELPTPDLNYIEHLSVKYSYQPWIIEHFISELDKDDTLKMLNIVNDPPKITIAINKTKTTKAKLIELLRHEGVNVQEIKEPKQLSEYALILSKTDDISCLKSFKDGLFNVMDIGAMLAVIAAISNMPKKPKSNFFAQSDNIIDLCAAPGGKSFFVAYNSNASILATDIYPKKVNIISSAIARLGLDNIKTSVADACITDKNLINTADLLILDMPCSGFGVVRKKPEIKLFKNKKDLEDLVNMQRRILSASYEYVKPKKYILYITCTINKSENLDNIQWFIQNYPFKLLDFSQNMPDIPAYLTAKKGYVQILPHHFNSDAFFVAVMKRSE